MQRRQYELCASLVWQNNNEFDKRVRRHRFDRPSIVQRRNHVLGRLPKPGHYCGEWVEWGA